MVMDYNHFLYREFPNHLSKLTESHQPIWGKMSAQQMVEHLEWLFAISNGKTEMEAHAEPERMAYRKMRFFEADIPFTKNFRTSFLSEEPNPTIYPNLESAKQRLLESLERFHDYLLEHPDIHPMHPQLGPLDRENWTRFHARHIKHHLTQFGLIPEE
jgi:hypothetical protein